MMKKRLSDATYFEPLETIAREHAAQQAAVKVLRRQLHEADVLLRRILEEYHRVEGDPVRVLILDYWGDWQ